MIVQLSPNQHFFRITTRGRKWNDVLSGRGSLYLPKGGNRYNVVLQNATYVTDNVITAVTEWAYYAARDWQDQIGNHCVRPIHGPLVSGAILWMFSVNFPRYVVDVEALAPILPWPPHVLLNPTNNYRTTHELTNLAVTGRFPGYPPPHPGLKVPAVRSRLHATSTESNYVLFRTITPPQGVLLGSWNLQIEFLDLSGIPVSQATSRVDWSNPRFQILSRSGPAPATPPLPLASWQSLQVNHL
jgi:hypothetical protein